MNIAPPPSLGTVTVHCSAKDLGIGGNTIVHARVFALRGKLAYWFPEKNERSSLILFDDVTKEWTRTVVSLSGLVPMSLLSSSNFSYTSFVARSFLFFTRTYLSRITIGEEDEDINMNHCKFTHRYSQVVETSPDDWKELQQEYYNADGHVLFGIRAGTSELYLLDPRPGGTSTERRLTVLPSGMQMMFAYDQRLYLLDSMIRCNKEGLSRLMLYNARRDELRPYACEKDLSYGYPKLPWREGHQRWFHIEDSSTAFFLCRDSYLWRLSLDNHEWLRLQPRLDSIIRPESARILSVSRSGTAIIGADDRFLSVSVTPRTPLAQVRHRVTAGSSTSTHWTDEADEQTVPSTRILCRLTNLRTVYPDWTMVIDKGVIDRTRIFSVGGALCYWERGFSLGMLRRPRFTLMFRREMDRKWIKTNIILFGSTPRVIHVDMNNAFVFFDRFLFRRIVWRSVARLRWLDDLQTVKIVGKWYVKGRHSSGQIIWESDNRLASSACGRLITMQPTSYKLRVLEPKKRKEHRILMLRESWLLRFAHKRNLYFVNETVLRSQEGITSLVALNVKSKERLAVTCSPDDTHGYPVVGTNLDEWIPDRSRNVMYTLDHESHIWRLDLFTFAWNRVDPRLPGADKESLVPLTRILSISAEGELIVLVNDHVIRAGVDLLQFQHQISNMSSI